MKIRTKLRILEIWAILSLAVVAAIAFSAAASDNRFEELTVERLNVVEKNGQLVMVAANSSHMPDPVINGKAWKTERPAGMLFYNGLGDENGGLVFGAVEGGGKYGAYHGLSFDKYKQAQAMALVYNDHSGKYRAGLQVWDRPETPLSEILIERERIGKMPDGPEKAAAQEKLDKKNFSPSRVYLGKNADSESELTLYDAKGKPRVRIVVTADGDAAMLFLDEDGKVIQSIPARSKPEK
ncbi:MAG: hypothetical protein IPM63_06730 [Acidobacteriota bacterium]|nr:MAG: hypothetical protein IPM63_06730 [Acidobacteriota bacterium]